MDLTIYGFLSKYIDEPTDTYIRVECPDDPGFFFEGTAAELLDCGDDDTEYIASLYLSSVNVAGDCLELVALR